MIIAPSARTAGLEAGWVDSARSAVRRSSLDDQRRRVIMIKARFVLYMVLTGVLLALAGSVGFGLAQEPQDELQPQGDLSLAAAVSSAFSYQGVLKEGGNPVTGNRDMTFRLYSDDACTTQVGVDIAKPGVEVTNGLFSVELEVNPDNVNGQGLWLEVEVDSTAIGCQEILPVPYALSLRPGAIISGTLTVGTLESPAYSYLWIPGTQTMMDTNNTDLVIRYLPGGSAAISANSSCDSEVVIPIDLPGVLYGQNVTVWMVRVYYQTQDSDVNAIDSTLLTKSTGAGTYVTLAEDQGDKWSATATNYPLLLAVEHRELDWSAGGLNLTLGLHFVDASPLQHEILIGGVRVVLGHE
jgi:hypothetical protein